MLFKRIETSLTSGEVTAVENLGSEFSVVHLEPVPGYDSWVSSEVPFGSRLIEWDLVGSLVDIENVITGRGNNRIIRQILSGSDLTIETELPLSALRQAMDSRKSLTS